MMQITHPVPWRPLPDRAEPSCVSPSPKNVLERSETEPRQALRLHQQAAAAAALAKSPPCLREKNSAGDTTAALLHTPTPTRGTFQL